MSRPKLVAILLLVGLISCCFALNPKSVASNKKKTPEVVKWDVVIDGKQRFPVTKIQSERVAKPKNTHNAMRKLLGALSNPVESFVAFLVEPGVGTNVQTQQPVHRMWVMIERNTVGDQLFVRLKDGATSIVLDHLNDTFTGDPLPPCGEVLRDSCAYSLQVVVTPTCDDLTFGSDLFATSLMCQSLITFSPIDPPNFPPQPIVNNIAIDFPIELLFTTLSQTDPASFLSTVDVHMRMRPPPVAIEATPFDDSSLNVSMIVTEACEDVFHVASNLSQLVPVTNVTEGDKICVFIEVDSEITLNVDITEVSACSSEEAGVIDELGSFRYTDKASEPDGACGKVFSGGYYPLFSLRNSQCMKQGGSCGFANTVRYDAATTDFQCINNVGDFGANACQGPSDWYPGGVGCEPGFTCGGPLAVHPLTTREVTEIPLPSGFIPASKCWPANATFARTDEALPCTPVTDDAHCITKCEPMRNFVVFETTIPYTLRSNTSFVRHEVRLLMQPQKPIFPSNRRLLSAMEKDSEQVGSFMLRVLPRSKVSNPQKWMNQQLDSLSSWFDHTKTNERVISTGIHASIAMVAFGVLSLNSFTKDVATPVALVYGVTTLGLETMLYALDHDASMKLIWNHS
jgi:hypothetical protein